MFWQKFKGCLYLDENIKSKQNAIKVIYIY